MRLIIVRHGIAIDREDPESPPEAERYLTKKGQERAREAARGLARLIDAPDVLISSPYVRAMQTAEIFAEAFGVDMANIQKTDALLPEARPAALFKLIKNAAAECVCCFGHAPNVDVLVATALGAGAPFTTLKKSGAAAIDLEKGGAQLVWLYDPKILRRAADNADQ